MDPSGCCVERITGKEGKPVGERGIESTAGRQEKRLWQKPSRKTVVPMIRAMLRLWAEVIHQVVFLKLWEGRNEQHFCKRLKLLPS